ncbi:unnamed protein product [Meloidogyne enterolobii]|uniref:Uncharacterized protein n=1 Tax=Meloidogyne enterolobii TaxID=390850 RepID=A0ACB1AHC6_MELEN
MEIRSFVDQYEIFNLIIHVFLKENGLGMVRSLSSDEQTSSVMIGPQLEGPLPKREIIEDQCVSNDLSNDRKRNWQEAGLEITDR